MRNKKLVTVLMVLALFALIMVGCGSQETTTPPDQSASEQASGETDYSQFDTYKWDFYVCVPANHPRNQGLIEMTDSLREITGGKLDITLRPAGEVPYKGPEAIAICASGAVQMSDANNAHIAGDSQVGAIPTYPFLVPSWDVFKDVIDALTPVFTEEMEAKGIKTLFYFPDPEQYLFGQGDVIETLADFKGRKMRGQNAYMQEFATKVGASSISITSNEIPDAISRSMIDTFVTSSVSTQAGKFYEFIDWTLKIPYSACGSWVIVNQDAWDSLPPEFQKLIEEQCAAMEEKYWGGIVPAQNEAALKEIGEYKDGHVKIYENNPTLVKEGADLMKDSWAKWAAEAGPYGEKAIQEVFKVLGY